MVKAPAVINLKFDHVFCLHADFEPQPPENAPRFASILANENAKVSIGTIPAPFNNGSGLIANMGLFDLFKPKKPRSLLDQLMENPIIQEQKALFDAMSMMCEDGCEADEIPGGYGEFGHAATNPVPTKTVMGSTSYLARLRSADGARVIYNRRGSLSSPVSRHPIDMYEIVHPDGRPLATIYLSPYHKKTSDKAPGGFALLETKFGSVALSSTAV